VVSHGGGWLSSPVYHVIPKSSQAQPATAVAGKGEVAKPKHAFESLLAPASAQETPSGKQTFNLKTPSEAGQAAKLAVQAQTMATKDPAGATELLKKFMPQDEAENIVKNNLFDALIQTLASSAKGKK